MNPSPRVIRRRATTGSSFPIVFLYSLCSDGPGRLEKNVVNPIVNTDFFRRALEKLQIKAKIPPPSKEDENGQTSAERGEFQVARF